jgi:hypothetical protein
MRQKGVRNRSNGLGAAAQAVSVVYMYRKREATLCVRISTCVCILIVTKSQIDSICPCQLYFTTIVFTMHFIAGSVSEQHYEPSFSEQRTYKALLLLTNLSLFPHGASHKPPIVIHSSSIIIAFQSSKVETTRHFVPDSLIAQLNPILAIIIKPATVITVPHQLLCRIIGG